MSELADLPLIEWGQALRAARKKRRRLEFRLALGALGIAMLGATIAVPPRPRLVWNASASAPRGLYLVAPGTPIARGDMVIARTPMPWRALAARRRYLPANVPLVKRVAAAHSDVVCARGVTIWINHGRGIRRRARDAQDRLLPWWEGCFRLGRGEAFLLMADADASFDGRYFGVTGPGDIIGKAQLLWAR